jgi:hypothetical protein
MEGLDIRLQKRINASLYTLIVLTGLLGLSVLFESCQVKQEVKNDDSNYSNSKGIALETR